MVLLLSGAVNKFEQFFLLFFVMRRQNVSVGISSLHNLLLLTGDGIVLLDNSAYGAILLPFFDDVQTGLLGLLL